jgi:hypothetical protein
VVLAALSFAAVIGLWSVGRLVGAGFDLGAFLQAGVLAFGFAAAIAGPVTLLSVTTLSRGIAGGIVGGVLVAMYVVFVVTQVAPDWSWLSPLSAWDHFRTTQLIDEGVFPVGDLALFAVFALGGWLAALWAFRRRDLAA